jgi:CheY-like chemotaxis protein
MSKGVKKKVLVVDDEPNVRQLVKRILSREYSVIEAENGEEAVNLAGSTKPAIIIMDMMMPVMDGLEACHIIKNGKYTRDIPVIILTAICTEANRKFAREVWGADEYLTKPFESRTLFETIDHYLK